MSRALILLSVVVLFSACAHRTPIGDQSLEHGDKLNVPVGQPQEPESFRVSDPQPPEVVDQELESIPLDYNEKVQQWLNYFQGRGRPHMERYLARSGRYTPIMKKMLRQNGLPEDLIYIALIESGFSSKATSHASAVGYWQFIKPTGKRYGLEVSALVDERRDPILSTQAAAEYFKGLYSVFGSWYLAMASYNVGENRVKREVMNHYTRDFWELARKRRFPKETINYIPKFIAAKMIGHDPAKYGFTDIEYEKPLEFELIRVSKNVNLKKMAAAMNYDYDDLKSINPKFKGEIAPLKQNENILELRVPIGMQTVAMTAAEASAVDKIEYIADAGDTLIHRVRKGDSLYTIAHRYKTNVKVLRDLNDLSPGRKLRIGMRLQVPERGGGGKKSTKIVAKVEKKETPAEKVESTQKATESAEVKTAEGTFYVVQPGDTLSQIADDYESTINELRKMNKLRKGSFLRVGLKLRVPEKDKGLPVDPSSDQVVPSRGPQAVIPIAHTVKPGETLSTIAKKYGVTVEALKKANRLQKKTNLKVGVRLVIPVSSTQRVLTPQVHLVRKGENLTMIAEKYRVSLLDLKSRNKITPGSKLFVGSRILIPQAIAARR